MKTDRSIVLDFGDALALVLRHAAGVRPPKMELVGLLASGARVLAEPVLAERDQPPFDRSTRDGFAVRAADVVCGTPLRLTGRLRAGEMWQGPALAAGEAIEIMTGAPMPAGADAVLMVEHVESAGAEITPTLAGLQSGENVVPRGAEANAGDAVLAPGTLIGAAEIALAATCGRAELSVYSRPRAAVIATGDELVELDQSPEPQQIRNSNSYGIAALIADAGGEAIRMPIARDDKADLHLVIAAARRGSDAGASDLLILSGGVSMGEYDLVEQVLVELGAEFFFTGVRMQPGRPVVFGRLPAHAELPEVYFFGLPGNPVSTQVTFQVFAETLLLAMTGAREYGPRFVRAALAEEVAGKPGLTRLLPAYFTHDWKRPSVRLVGWQGSGDVAANARANAYALFPPGAEATPEGTVLTVMLR